MANTANIDNLSIQISSSADGATRGIDALVAKLGKLKSVVDGAASGASKVSKAFEDTGASAGGAAVPIGALGNEMVTAKIRVDALAESFRNITAGIRNLDAKLGQQKGTMENFGGGIQSASNRLAQLGNEMNSANTSSQFFKQGIDAANKGVIETADDSDYAAQHTRSFGNVLAHIALSPIKTFSSAIASGISAVQNFISNVARIAKYRFIRSMIKDLGQSFRDLYGYSEMFGTGFSDAMDSINTSTTYLRNSLAAMVDPLIELFAPMLEVIIDQVVELMNWFNQLFAALSGQQTYTVARRVENAWSNTFNSTQAGARQTASELKRTILGFDEINKLNDNTNRGTSGGSRSSPFSNNYEIMFEERELQGFLRDVSEFTDKMPDWLKWLFGGATLIGGFLLISKLIDKVKGLFSDSVPNWVDKMFDLIDLFDGNEHPLKIDIPDELKDLKVKVDIPDDGVDLKVNTQKGLLWDEEAWRAANMSGDTYRTLTVDVVEDAAKWSKDAFKAATVEDGSTATASLIVDCVKDVLKWSPEAWVASQLAGDNTVTLTVDVIKDVAKWSSEAWKAATMEDGIINKALQVAVKMDGVLESGFDNAMVKAIVEDNWDDTAWAAALMSGTSTRTLEVGVKKAEWNSDAWKAANMARQTVERSVNVAVNKATWDKNAWSAANMGGATVARMVNVAVNKAAWDKHAWSAANMGGASVIRTVNAAVIKATWDKNAWSAANMGGASAIRTIKSAVIKATWDKNAWSAANMGGATAVRTINAAVKKAAWDASAWNAANMGGKTIARMVNVAVGKAAWSKDAWSAANMGGATNYRFVKVAMDKATWDKDAWSAANMGGQTVARFLNVAVNRASWDDAAWSAANMGGSTVARFMNVAVSRAAWDDNAWSAANMGGSTVARFLNVAVNKALWDDDAWKAANMGGATNARFINVAVNKAEWDDAAWLAALMADHVTTITVNISLVKDGWTTIETYLNDSFGGAEGGGGGTRGGGVGRFHVPLELEAPTEEAVTLIVDDTESIWSDIFRLAGHGLQLVYMGPDADTIIDLVDDFTTIWNKNKPKVAPEVTNNTNDQLGSYKGWWDDNKTKWWNKLYVSPEAQNTANTMLSTLKGWWDESKLNWWNRLYVTPEMLNNTNTMLSNVKSWWDDNKDKWYNILYAKVEVKNESWSWWNNVTSWWNNYAGKNTLTANAKVNVSGGGGGVTRYATTKAKGGVYSNGVWNDIPQYASGTLNAGSIFAAGEHGPELVGHIGGRTEVLNKSQLAATMYSAVQAAMAPASANFAAAATQMYKGADGMNGEDMETLMEMVRQTNDATMRQNELLREQNDYLRQLNDKDFTAEITTSGISRAQARANRRAGTTVIPVGT